jgi:toxin ParE1/3/4
MTEHYKVVYSAVAKEDLKNVYSYIAFILKEKQTAARQTNRIRQSIRELETMPARYASVDWEPWTTMGMRKMPVDNYVVFYLVDAQEHIVNIVRIFYGGRDIENILRGE